MLELARALAAWIEWYITRYLHCAMGYPTPSAFEQEHLSSHSTQFATA